MITCKTGGQNSRHVPGIQDVESPWSDKKELIAIIQRIKILCDIAKELEKAALAVGLPDLPQTINAQRPSFFQFWG